MPLLGDFTPYHFIKNESSKVSNSACMAPKDGYSYSSEIAETVFGRKGLILVGVFQNIELFSAAVMYIILLGTGWSDLFKAYPQLGLKQV